MLKLIPAGERVATLAFSRPEKKNAITAAMYESLAEVLKTGLGDKARRVPLATGVEGLRGEGGVLCLLIHPRPPVA